MELLHHRRRVGDEEKTEIRVVSDETNLILHIIWVMVAENSGVVKPKYQQYTSLNKMWSNFSKVLMAHIFFTAVIIYNRGIGKGIDGIRKGTTKNYIYVLWLAAWRKKETKTVVHKWILPPCPKTFSNFPQLHLFLFVGPAKPLCSLAPLKSLTMAYKYRCLDR